MANILHKIKANLYANVLTKDNPNDFIARTAIERSLNVKQICEAAISRGGADITAAAMEHATELFLREMAYQLCDGYSVNTGYFTASTNIRGVFNSPAEKFDPEKHNILFQFNQGEKLRAEIPNIEVNILGVAEASSIILQVRDIKSGSVNDLLTPGRNLKIIGSKIKISGEDKSNGIFFMNNETKEKTPVEASDVVTNNPSELIIIIPALPAGTYTLGLLTQFAGSSMLKEGRTVVFDQILTVR